MAYLPPVKQDKPFENLIRNLLCFPGLDRLGGDILAEITMGDIFHCDVDLFGALVPAQKADKEMAMLFA